MRHTLAPILCIVVIPLTLPVQLLAGDWEVVYDGKTKFRLKDARFTAGTRQLSWLAADDKAATTKAKGPAGPEYLEFREEQSTSYKDGIVTYIPVASLVSLEYDHDKRTSRIAVKQAGETELTLIGSTRFVGINKFSLEGTALAKADVSVEGTLQFQDGLMKTPVRGFVHHAAKPLEAPSGRAALIVAQDKEKSSHMVRNLMPLYKVGAGQKRAAVLMFQKIGQIDIAKLSGLRQLPPPSKKLNFSHEYEATLLGGDKQTLTLLDSTQLEGGQKATLIGLVGRVAAGYKLFPPHTIAEIRFEKAD